MQLLEQLKWRKEYLLWSYEKLSDRERHDADSELRAICSFIEHFKQILDAGGEEEMGATA